MKPPVWIFVAALPLLAETPLSSVSGPMLGSLFDAPSGRVRPLAGIPSSAILGEPSEDSPRLAKGIAVPGHAFAVGVEAETGIAVLAGPSLRIEIPGIRTGAARIALSPLGRSAGFYFDESRSVQIVAGLPDQARVIRESPLSGVPVALAISDDGRTLLAALDQGGASVLVKDQVGPGYSMIGTVGPISALEFFPGSADALFSQATSVWSVRNGQIMPLIPEDEGLEGIVGVAASADGSTIFAALRSGQIVIRNLDTATTAQAACSCTPEGLARLLGSAVFRLNSPGDAPVWLLDASGDSPRIRFVAAPERRPGATMRGHQ